MTHPYENRRDDGTNPGDQFRGPSSSDRDSGRFGESWGGDRSGGGDLFDELNGTSTSSGDYGDQSYADYDQYNEYSDYGDDDDSFSGVDESGAYHAGNYSDDGYEPVEYSGDYEGPAAYTGYDEGQDSPSSEDDGKLDSFGGDKAGTILIAALGALAVIASILMMFTDSVTWMKVAGLAALWAGVVGGILTTKYRRQLEAERQRVREIEERHRVEMEKEVITHREQELLLEQNYLDSVDQDRDEMLAQLRAEVQALREHLVEIIGGSFDEERVALRARAERLRELEEANPAKSAANSSTPLTNPESFNRPTPRVHDDRKRSTTIGSTKEADEPVDVPVVDTPSETAGASAGSDSASGFSTSGFRSTQWSPSGSTLGQASASSEKPAAKASSKSDSTPTSKAAPKTEPKAAPKAEPKMESKPEAKAQSTPAAKAAKTPSAQSSAPSADSRPTQVAPAKSRWAQSSDAPAQATAEPKKDMKPDQSSAPTVKPSAAQSAAATNVMPQVPDSAVSASASSTDKSEQSGQANAPHGRRRAEDRSDGLTVAELLAQMRQNRG